MNEFDVVGIDGDIIRYRVGFAAQTGRGDMAEPEPIENCLHSVKVLIKSIQEAVNAKEVKVYLSGKTNFREEVATEQVYKGNRIGMEKPYHYHNITDYLLDRWEAVMVEGQEADDALGILITNTPNSVCASLDKDLLTVPGWHYNWVKQELVKVSPLEAAITFYTQMLTGDSVDNIPGLYKLTGHKASKKYKEMVAMCPDDKQMWEVVYNIYAEHYKGERDVEELLTEVGRLLYIRHNENEEWNPPTKKEKVND